MAIGSGHPLASESDISGTKAAGVDWFASDLSPLDPASTRTVTDKPIKIVIQISLSATAGVEWTWDGTNYSKLNGGTDLTLDVTYRFAVTIRPDDVFNLRTVSGAATVTVDLCRVEEYPDEA